ncbi:eukaryotic translation initiation factor 3 subunit G, partial [Cyanistes caeruleus]|uniref:eukaryotic translation initiation factor 3 subunit G n=1 Tax=Cyanistes caeruleus TaxID=156563 RepID=UPI000CDA1559
IWGFWAPIPRFSRSQIIRTFRIETRKASKAVARRKNWKKFGNSEFDAPGPNVATTTVSDDVFMTFITSKEDLNCQEEEDPMNKLKGQKIVSCRICKGDHWTTRCPYKDTLGPMQKELAEQLGLSTGEKEKLPGGENLNPCFFGNFGDFSRFFPGFYVVLSLWWPQGRCGGPGQEELAEQLGLSTGEKEKLPGARFFPFSRVLSPFSPQGFAFISFHRREDAARAIAGVSGFGYDHLILNVEWAKPSTN